MQIAAKVYNTTNTLLTEHTWLSLSQAARHLQVHPTSLRRWADQGYVPHIVTPGGHRRFTLAALDLFAREHEQAAGGSTSPEHWAQRALTTTRISIQAPAEAGWMQSMSPEMRERHRLAGRKLMALTLQYISADDGAHLLEEARELGREYGELSMLSGTTLANAFRAALFFRDKLLEASLDLPETTRLHRSDQSRLLLRINTLLNTVQLSIAEVYELPATDTKAIGASRLQGAQARRPRR